jgi:glycosyltransferase involved in cell wall biosynthesis
MVTLDAETYTERVEPKVSIGMPLYNAEQYLEETMETILSQTFSDFELIISDNASTDRTDQICRSYAARDSRIRYDRNLQNMGAAYNYNKVFLLARGKYFKHAAHDDLLAPTYLERLVEVLDREPGVVLAYPRCQVIDENGAPLSNAPETMELRSRQTTPHERFRAYIPRGNPQRMCDPIFGLFRTEMFGRTGMIGSYIAADAILLGETALHGEIEEVPEVLFLERWHAGGSVRANPTLDDRYAWFDPKTRGKLSNVFVHWRWTIELLRAIDRAPISRAEKVRCYLIMRLYVARNLGGLAGDLYWASRYLARITLSNLLRRNVRVRRPSQG